MRVEEAYWTGKVHEVAETLRRSIGQYIRHASDFKIGATARPRARARRHAKDEWDRMVFFYRTRSVNFVAQAERYCIQHGWDVCEQGSWNTNPGGEGLVDGKDVYFLYVLLYYEDDDYYSEDDEDDDDYEDDDYDEDEDYDY